ncbi:putative quinol monooxygenase [Nocardia jejuensis]|uniref:putative quinol monooxygenase n=1 Tax=Nocardia jejuensis TaxID=328049 RepID=UPI00082EF6A1|nr:putative quinol monooxygenase [Nocardia jejuensis]
MPQISLLSRIRVKSGRGAEFIAAFRKIFVQAEQEPGTLVYLLNRAEDNPDLFWVTELYADEAALSTHRDGPEMTAASGVFAELIAAAEFLIGEPVAMKGVPG